MEIIADLVKLILPAGLVLYGMYLTVKSFVNKEISALQEQVKLRQADALISQKEVELKNKEQTLPIRLQAYERMCLFLERIAPAQLIPRLNNPEFSVGLFHQILLQEIRNEFAHNLSQQMYVSDDAWLFITKAMEETILFINNCTVGLNEENSAIELSKKILTSSREFNINPTQDAIQVLKNEIRQLF